MKRLFTGIIEETGRISSVRNEGNQYRLTVEADKVLADLKIGDSIAVNGICLTVAEKSEQRFAADVMPETLRRSSLGGASRKQEVNLERALRLSDRLGGHLVSGHIDGTGSVISMVKEGNALILAIRAEPGILRYMIEKGSVALDGVSLTIIRVEQDQFAVSLIPLTALSTIIGSYKTGGQVNIECDLIGKYVEKLLNFQNPGKNNNQVQARNQDSVMNLDYLIENEF